MKLQKQLQNLSWEDIDENMVDEYIKRAVELDAIIAKNSGRAQFTRNDIITQLQSGKTISYDSDWYAEIRDADAQKPVTPKYDYPEGRKLDCGCVVYNRSEVMIASPQNCT